MQPSSFNSAASTSPRRRELERAVEAYVQRLMADHPEVVEVIWFGSWATGQPGRYSDVDLCVVLSVSPIARARDRIPLYLPDRFPGGIDLFPYTRAELDAMRTTAPAWWHAIRDGRTVASRPAARP